MGNLVALIAAVGLLQLPPASLSEKRQTLRPVVLISTLSPADLATQATTLEHDTEVSRSETITIVLTIPDCEKGANAACNTSADLVTYKPDGTVHSEVKNVSLNNRRVTTPLKLAAGDPTGLYKVVATVRDLNARRLANAERIFGVK
jgi:hypothetical protein